MDHSTPFDGDHIDHGSPFHHDEHGNFEGTTIKNSFGGKDYFGPGGHPHGSSTDNLMGGHSYFNSHGGHMGDTISGMGHNNFLGADGHFHSTPDMLHSDHVNTMRMSLLNRIK
jgi:hypothetical protein